MRNALGFAAPPCYRQNSSSIVQLRGNVGETTLVNPGIQLGDEQNIRGCVRGKSTQSLSIPGSGPGSCGDACWIGPLMDLVG